MISEYTREEFLAWLRAKDPDEVVNNNDGILGRFMTTTAREFLDKLQPENY